MSDDFVDPVEWGVAHAARAGIGLAAALRVDHRFRRSGRVRCGLRVIEGNQPGLSGRWRVGLASFSVTRLTFRPRWPHVRGGCPPIKVVAVQGPPRVPCSKEVLKLPGSAVRIRTPTATLEWSVQDRYRPAIVKRLRVPYSVLAQETAD